MYATRRATFPTILFALLTLAGAPGCDAPEDEDLGTVEQASRWFEEDR